MNNPIRPNHYKLKIKGVECEVMDIIEAVGADDSFSFGNAIKYLLRHQHKNGIEDLKKCKFYIDRMIMLYSQNDIKVGDVVIHEDSPTVKRRVLDVIGDKALIWRIYEYVDISRLEKVNERNK